MTRTLVIDVVIRFLVQERVQTNVEGKRRQSCCIPILAARAGRVEHKHIRARWHVEHTSASAQPSLPVPSGRNRVITESCPCRGRSRQTRSRRRRLRRDERRTSSQLEASSFHRILRDRERGQRWEVSSRITYDSEVAYDGLLSAKLNQYQAG